MNNNIKVTCWGSRGSGPAPYTEQMEYGGNTSCFTIETGQMLLVLDGGTGLAALGREMMKNPDDKRDLHIFISHYFRLDAASVFMERAATAVP